MSSSYPSPPGPRAPRRRTSRAPKFSLPSPTHSPPDSPSHAPPRPGPRPVQPLTPLTSSPPSSDSPADAAAANLSPLERLEALLEDITSVLRGYSRLPARSPYFLSSLHDFHARALALHPARPYRSSSSISTLSTPLPSHQTKGELRSEDVEMLERDWKNSEVVAAWYGPRTSPRSESLQARRSSRPGRGGGVSTRGKNSAENIKAEEGLKREASYVGLHDE